MIKKFWEHTFSDEIFAFYKYTKSNLSSSITKDEL